jgi:mycothiol synthase
MAPLSEHKMFVVEEAAPGTVGCWGEGSAGIVAVAAPHRHPDGRVHWAVEVAVAPGARSGEEVAIAVGVSLVPDGADHTLWVSRTGQRLAARGLGYLTLRTVLRMETALPVASPVPVDGYVIRSFRPGRDEDALAAVNNRAFAGHRENDSMSGDDIRAREARSWFDVGGFLVAEAGDGTHAGFCWTKVHPDGVGEIYVIGVDPAHHGRGLGRWLVLSGLDRLHRQDRAEVGMLWTDADNPAVDRLYRPIGFGTVAATEEMRTSSEPGPP